jgi:DNA-binding winged helix-turn-helix (wHTH) protein
MLGSHFQPKSVQSSSDSQANLSSVTRFGTFELDLASGELRKQGRKIRLPNQPFQILRILAQRSGDLVTREELQRLLWPVDTIIDFEIGLNSAIRQLRAALGDCAKNPVFVETVPRHGYRFLAAAARSGYTNQIDAWKQVFQDPGTAAFPVPQTTQRLDHDIARRNTLEKQGLVAAEPATDSDFREAYVLGRYFWNHETREALLRSHKFLSSAIEKKPDSGEAHAALADWYLAAGTEGLLPHHEALAYAKVAAVRAFALDPGLAEVHACLGPELPCANATLFEHLQRSKRQPVSMVTSSTRLFLAR